MRVFTHHYHEKFVPMRGNTNQGEDVLMLGEAYHNNHHKYPSSVNFRGVRWHEVDPVYPAICLLRWLHIIRIKDLSFKHVGAEF